MRAYEFLFLSETTTSFRDAAFVRFWWRNSLGFEWIEEPHADYVINYLSEIGSGDYDDELLDVGETEDEVNDYFIKTRNAVRGGIIKNSFDVVYLDSNKLRNIHTCLTKLLEDFPTIRQVTIDCNQIHETLEREKLAYFISKGKIPRNIIEDKFLNENAPRTLYHGTLKSNIPAIKQRGLEPRLGDFTKHFYDDDPDLEELVFASSKNDIKKGLNSIIYYLRQRGIEPTPENIIRYGAMVVVKDEYDEFSHRPLSDLGSWYDEHPRQVEPGDFYAKEPVGVTYILQNNKLRDLLRRQGFDAWMGNKHPKLDKQVNK